MFKKKHNVVIMDGTNNWVSNEIIGIVGACSCPDGGLFKVDQLDRHHPSMLTISFKSDKKTRQLIEDIVETIYPGLCSYDVVIA